MYVCVEIKEGGRAQEMKERRKMSEGWSGRLVMFSLRWKAPTRGTRFQKVHGYTARVTLEL